MQRMRNGCPMLFLVLLAFVYCCCKPLMARHTHHRHAEDEGCSRCPPGFGVKHHCTRNHDTECSPCQPGHYSPHHSASRPCYPCSRCGFGLYVAHVCTAARDTMCDSCHTYRGPHNQDFYSRCVQRLIAETQTNSTRTDEVDHTGGEGLPLPARALHLKERARSSPFVVVLLGGVAVCAIAGLLLAAIVSRCCGSRHWKVSPRYPYHAVATQEAVML